MRGILTQETFIFSSFIIGGIIVVGILRIIAIESMLKEILKILKNNKGNKK